MYCSNCGTKIDDGSNYCYKCGNKVSTDIKNTTQSSVQQNKKIDALAYIDDDPLIKVIVVFSYVSVVIRGFFILSLTWTIPMLYYLQQKIKNNKKIGVAFRICYFLFVSGIGGFLLFFLKRYNIEDLIKNAKNKHCKFSNVFFLILIVTNKTPQFYTII